MLTRHIPRPSVALVVAFVALFAALGGTGYAALKITGKDIVNGTVTGADVDNKSLAGKELKPDTLGGAQIKESALGAVPEAAHAAAADTAATAAKATDADAVGGIPASQLMTSKTRGYEASISETLNFGNDSVLRTLADLPAGAYLVTARLTYSNPGAAGQESCRLELPGADDVVEFSVEAAGTETVSLQEVTVPGSIWNATLRCSSDGSDDLLGVGSLIAVRLD